MRGGHGPHRRRSSILSGLTRSDSSCSRHISPRLFARLVSVKHYFFHRRRSPIMLNALSRAAIGALKAGKSNLTPKIVQNELPKAMVATSSNCEYDVVSRGVFSYLAGRLSGGNSADLSIFSVYRRKMSVGCTLLLGQRDRCGLDFRCGLGTSFAVMAPPAAAAFNVLGLYLSSILLCLVYRLRMEDCFFKRPSRFSLENPVSFKTRQMTFF